MKTLTIYVEGGGDAAMLKTKCRRAFRLFLEKSGFTGKMPRIVACGSRNAAFDSFCIAKRQGSNALLLIDSEAPVQSVFVNPWEHLKKRDDWDRPQNASDDDCHLMVQVMETWFFADISAVERYFGKGFNANVLPKRANIEEIPKPEIESALNDAAKNTKKKDYSKGRDSFEILGNIDPAKVTQQLPWANRFVMTLKGKL